MSNAKNKIVSIYKLSYYIVAIWISVLLFSCSQEAAVPVSADFDFTIVDNDYSIPVRIKLSNKSVGAESYQWTFEGADRTSSTDRNPGTLIYNEMGIYKILLEASNTDGSKDSKELEFSLDAPIEIGFNTEILTNNFAPATVAITNITKGASSFQWSFEGGDPATSTATQPGSVIFEEPGEYVIRLVVGNGREIRELERTITVGEKLMADFDWEVAFPDDDFQIPVTITLINKSTGALEYTWGFSNAVPLNSNEKEPAVVFDQAGTHTLTLTVSNGKETQTLSKTFEVFEDINLRTVTDVRFGINTAHNSDTIGAYFSTTARETYTKTESGTVDGGLIDIVFFGLGADFSFNKFVSPDALSDTSFEPISNASKTVFINSQEQCDCGTSLSPAEFDDMVNDDPLRPLSIKETEGGKQDFSNANVPRIVVFQTADGRKGAIKIKEYVNDGQHSYILTNIKMQKESR